MYRSGSRTGGPGAFSLGLITVIVLLCVFGVLVVGAGYLEFDFYPAQVLFGI